MPRIVLISYFHAKNKGKKEFQISDSKYTFTAWLFPVDGKIPPISHNKRNILGGKKSCTIAHHPCCHGERSPCSACESLFSLLHVFSFHLSKIFWTTEETRTTRKAMGGRVNIEQLCSRSKSLRNQKHFRSRALLVLMAETILGKARHLGGFCVESHGVSD